MTKYRSVAGYAAATILFAAASLMAAPGLADAGLELPAMQPVTSSLQVQDNADPVMIDQLATSASDDNKQNSDTDTAIKASSLPALVSALSTTEVANAEQQCLAGAVYFESKGEPLEGQLAVAEVIINRSKSGRFPGSLCSVVYQRGQFSFVRGNAMPPIARESRAWREAATIARIAIEDRWTPVVPKAMFFHARRVSPGWKLARVATVGNHIFYR